MNVYLIQLSDGVQPLVTANSFAEAEEIFKDVSKFKIVSITLITNKVIQDIKL